MSITERNFYANDHTIAVFGNLYRLIEQRTGLNPGALNVCYTGKNVMKPMSHEVMLSTADGLPLPMNRNHYEARQSRDHHKAMKVK